ncbi:GTP cyclohydrolase FolE2 [Fundidesulfovibrio agrisoli]|uniref:GTP cyclohydrolase FolE2 n=1 Tax=Fundidesulfovibrio agrisoli TaxID=2922717 RepID=UPI001FAE5C00|nr:GTP cyclohydrolase FolE2 [Fundidesulfovibrio agrisoli]
MKDIQSSPADVSIAIDRVGIKSLRLPLTVKDREHGSQHTVAEVDLAVDLPAQFKGTHMSRFVEALEGWKAGLDYQGFKELVADVRERLEAQNAHVTMRFPYFMRRSSPASGAVSNMDYACTVQGDLVGQRFSMTLGVEVPVMTVCPCSLAISDQGAHSQRTVVRARCRFKGFMWLEELIAMAEGAGSSPVYSLLKREDEKHVTEAAFANPCFVEDVVRGVAKALEEHPRVTWYSVDVESFESIHNHCAVAGIERTKG